MIIRAAAALLVSVAPAAAQEAQLAVVGPMTGLFAEFGAELVAGAERAAVDLGGFSIVTADDACDEETARAEANRLVGVGADFVVGHVCFQAALAAAPVYAAAGIPFISPAVQNARLTTERAGPGVFRLAATDGEAAELAGTLLGERFGEGRVAFLSDGSGSGAAFSSGAEARFRALGGEPVYIDQFQPGSVDYAFLAARLDLETVDAVLVAGAGADVGQIAAALAALGRQAAVVAGEAAFAAATIEAAGNGAGSLLVVAPRDARLNPDAAEVVAAFRADGVEPDGYTLASYAAVQVFAGARAADGDVVAAIQDGAFETVIGPVSFSPQGDLEQPAYEIFAVEGGRFGPVED